MAETISNSPSVAVSSAMQYQEHLMCLWSSFILLQKHFQILFQEDMADYRRDWFHFNAK
jgi:hypothetical protein